MPETNIEQYFENILTVSFYIAKFESKAIGKLGEGLNTEDTLIFISNKLDTKLASLKANIKEYEKRIAGKRGLTEITITKKKIFDKYFSTGEEELIQVVLDIIQNKNPQLRPKINKNKDFDKNTFRIFNDYGKEQFSEHFYLAVDNNNHSIPDTILFDDEFTSVLEGAKKIDRDKKFKNKFEFGKYIYELLEDVEIDIFSNSYIWNWLSAFYFKQIFPGPNGGMQDIRYILSQRENYRYRHLLRESWRLYSEFKESSIYLLSKPLNFGSDEIEQLASRNTFLNINTIKLCGEFYMIKQGNGYFLKKNASSKSIPGNMRRLEDVCKGINLNYFIPTMEYEKFKQMILKIPEFKNWI